MKSIGQKISALLDEKNMTQRELAEKVGVTEVTVGRYVKDYRQPKADILAKIALILGTPIEYFFTESFEPNDSIKNKNVKIKASSKTQTLDQFIESANALFMDASEEDRDILYKTLSDIYFDSKAKNREKYNPNKNKTK